MARDDGKNNNRSRGPRRPPGPGGGGRSGGRSGGDRSGGERGRFREERGEGRRFGEKRSFGGKRDGLRKDRENGSRGERREGGFKRQGDFKKEGSFRKDFKPRGERSFSRDDRSRGDRPPRREPGDRPPRRDFEDRPQRARSDRPRGNWGDHPRSERRESGFRKDFKPRDRDSRPPRREFDSDKPRREFRSDRPHGEFRSERPRRDDRDGGFKRDFKLRGEGRDGGFKRDFKPRSRDDRPPRARDDERKSFGERGERKSFGERKPFRDRDSRPREERRPLHEDRAPAASKTGERIAKVVARAGLCSRREAEAWITEGRVAVNGRVITSPALDVMASDKIIIDGKPLPPREKTRLFLYHKPRGLVTTHADPEGRPTVFSSLPGDLPRVISVGRLDYNTEGLLLLTNDGALARALELPANGWLRRYRVRAHGSIAQAQLDALKDGIEIDGVRYGAITATLDRDQGANVWMTFEIREGKNREVRNVLAHLGLDVNRLIRVSYGPFQLGELAEGVVEEVGAGTLRAELGSKIAGLLEREDDKRTPKPRRTGLIADRKGRRVLVERGADVQRDDDDGGDSSPRPPKRRYHGKSNRN